MDDALKLWVQRFKLHHAAPKVRVCNIFNMVLKGAISQGFSIFCL